MLQILGHAFGREFHQMQRGKLLLNLERVARAKIRLHFRFGEILMNAKSTEFHGVKSLRDPNMSAGDLEVARFVAGEDKITSTPAGASAFSKSHPVRIAGN